MTEDMISSTGATGAVARILVEDVAKDFTLHAQGGVRIPVMAAASASIFPGECVALVGESGAGKSTLMRMIYGNYRIGSGGVRVRLGPAVASEAPHWIDVAAAAPHEILELRRSTVGYVSQFLRVIPRVSTLDVVAEPLRANGASIDDARAAAEDLLERLRIRRALWELSPLTFSGGEQQRVNIARGFAHRYPVLLIDEPTASLDPTNRETVLEMIADARDQGASIVCILHDVAARERLRCRDIDVSAFSAAAA